MPKFFEMKNYLGFFFVRFISFLPCFIGFYLRSQEAVNPLGTVTVTGTKIPKRQLENPIIVDVISEEKLAAVAACTLSDGLRFQTGLRVEVNCQTCNYTQLRMNGLGGGYSQILLNSRPIFSSLTGLYGLEQIPSNMIDRIEVVKGGSSVLYGSNAIGGTVNIFTRIPKKNQFKIAYNYQNIKGSSDQIIRATSAVVNQKRTLGASFFINGRDRAAYDANGDHFSELPLLKNTSFGTHLFLIPSDREKVNLSFSKINEYRMGGLMLKKAAHLLDQSEERTHNVYMVNADYKLDFNDYDSSFLIYFGSQHTDRLHYTGIFPDMNEDIKAHLEKPPYGDSKTTTYQGGVQINHHFEDFFIGSATVTFGMEYLKDDILDQIDAYDYKIDQSTENTGVFLQHDWVFSNDISLLSGIRVDKHNMVDKIVINPRVALLYKPFENTQVRASFATGFRAPQAFDTDLHIAFAGGGVSRISLAKNLMPEDSRSYSLSLNYDCPKERYIYGFTLEGFYTTLNNTFYQALVGKDDKGSLFEKRNGGGAKVKGLTVSFRANYDQIVQLEAGFTIQTSLFDRAVENVPKLVKKRNFLRTPNDYGYATLSIKPTSRWSISVNYLYTGKMEMLHLAGSPEQLKDSYHTSETFSELGFRGKYQWSVRNMGLDTNLILGVKNLFDAYQQDFDTGKNRDSNYVYGPAFPRTYFLGLEWIF